MDDLLNIDLSKITEKDYKGFESIKATLPPEHQKLLDNVNEGIEYIRENQHMFGCNAECKKNMKEEALYQQFINAKVSLDNAPNNLETAERNFISFKDGGMEYQKMVERRKSEEAKINVQKMKEKFMEKYRNLKIMIDAYTDQNMYDSYVTELSDMYKDKISNLENENEKYENENNMANRMTYYNSEWISFFTWLNMILKYPFWFILILYLVLSVIYKRYTLTSFKIGAPILLLLAFIPLQKMINIWYQISE